MAVSSIHGYGPFPGDMGGCEASYTAAWSRSVADAQMLSMANHHQSTYLFGEATAN